MPRVTDPVCGMVIDSETAAAHEPHGNHEHYFCSQACARAFRLEPARYTAAEQMREQTPPHMEVDGIVTPMFGSAGSGGAEYEPAGGEDRFGSAGSGDAEHEPSDGHRRS